MNISMKYNPYKLETMLATADLDLMKETKFSKYQGERLQVWVEHIFPLLEEVLNDDTYRLIFTGTLPDFEDVLLTAQRYTDTYGDVSIDVEHIAVEEVEDKFTVLEELVDLMQEGPFEKLRDPKIQHNFEKALNSEFEIAVIATMSSGKSTLINAMLGRELMPSKNQACTAKISKIRNSAADNFSAIAYDTDGLEFKSIKNATVEDFKEFNNDSAISLIEIEGNIPSIRSGKMNLVLVDTPGPNNSSDSSHRLHTLSVIKNDDKPMVLYVLNGTQLETDDDLELLRTVAEAMAVGGKQSKDRFIFAINKADEFDPESGENLEDIIFKVKSYLEKIGIYNPNIYPISAQMAKVIRKSQNGLPMTKKELSTLNSLSLFTDQEAMHFNNYAPLSPSLKNSIYERVLEARTNNDEQIETLYYTGVPSVEAAINEYLDKYAVSSKITNAVNTFKRIVEQEKFMQSLQEELENNEEQREQVLASMERIEEQLAHGVQATQFKEKIRKMNFNVAQYFDDLNEKVFGERVNLLNEELRGDRMRKIEADTLLYKMEKNILMLQDDAVTDLEKIISTSLRENAERYLNEYQEYVSGIMDFEMSSIQIANWDKAITADTPDITSLLNDFSYIEEEVVGKRTVVNENKKWYKPWTWREEKEFEVDVYGDVEYVDLAEVRDSFMVPVIKSLRTNFKNAESFMESELNRLQKFFIEEIDRLDKVMKIRVKEIKKLSLNSKILVEEMEQKQKQKEWLKHFTERLDKVLELEEKVGISK
ncbi:dynamin family protein [Psychrobacillus sp. PGGUH221]|uniref:dynamin family protein n=1 Tax=Psychrobacillus sp. PGGUH221 TaxID=3020058 RepID=UPI0035C785AC